MHISKFLRRFRAPLKRLESEDMDVVIGAAKRCLNTTDGEILMIHLIDKFGLDDQSGVLPSDDANYQNGTKDVMRYILALTNDK
jgi:hypothetical protein